MPLTLSGTSEDPFQLHLAHKVKAMAQPLQAEIKESCALCVQTLLAPACCSIASVGACRRACCVTASPRAGGVEGSPGG